MADTGWDRDTSPYHPGEVAVHQRLGLADRQEATGRRMYRPYMPDQHREFFAQLPFFVAGSVDGAGQPWASVLFGPPGFVSTPDERTLGIAAMPLAGDPLGAHLVVGAPLGFVGIELHSRRRNRVNGVVTAITPQGFEVGVVQSFGNCPKYIHVREADAASAAPLPGAAEDHMGLAEAAGPVIARADMFFVASTHAEGDKYDTGGTDVNYRGGKPGFVRVEGNTLTVPDFAGNNAFNTIGNFMVTPRAGLLFIDFATGDLWQVTGDVRVLWEMPPDLASFEGAKRAWQVEVTRTVRLPAASPLAWSLREPSANTLKTGSWT